MIYFRLVDKRDLFTQCYLHIAYQIHSSILGYYMASDNAIKSPLALKCHQYQPFHNEHVWGRAHIALAQRWERGGVVDSHMSLASFLPYGFHKENTQNTESR